MKTRYTVYRMDYVTRRKEAIGCILERRGRDRGKNLMCLLLEARRLFTRWPSDAINIVLDSPKYSRDVQEAGFGIVSIDSQV